MPWINKDCRGCRKCLRACMFLAIKFENGAAFIDQDRCVKCDGCLNNICAFEAIRPDSEVQD